MHNNKSKELPGIIYLIVIQHNCYYHHKGMMEIQFGQAFLNAVFYEYVASLVQNTSISK